MLPTTPGVDDRIRELHATAAELRHERSIGDADRIGWMTALRLRLGATLLAAGSALVSSAQPMASTRTRR